MPEPSVQAAQRQRRANWIGLRTLRQHPKVVGETADGDPIYEVRSVRLLLRAEGTHFHLLVQCSKCGRDVAGSAVVGMADLDRPSHSVICQACVRGSDMSAYRLPEKGADDLPAAPSEPPDLADEGDGSSGNADPSDDPRLAAIEIRLEAALTQLRELAESHGRLAADIGRRPAADEVTEHVDRRLHEAQAAFAASVDARLAGLDATVSDAMAQGRFELASLEERLNAAVVALTQMVELQRSDVDATIDGLRPGDMESVARTVARLEAAVKRVEARVEGLVAEGADESARVDALTTRRPAAGGDLMSRLERQLRQAEDRLAQRASPDGDTESG